MKVPQTLRLLALDIGAGSGRSILGEFNGRKINLCETCRFSNKMVNMNVGVYWNIALLLEEVRNALRASRNRKPEAVAIDTWGLDYCLFSRHGELLGLPHSYRDPRSTGMKRRVFEKVPKAELFNITGIQFMEINTIYQLFAHVQKKPRTFQYFREIVSDAGYTELPANRPDADGIYQCINHTAA